MKRVYLYYAASFVSAVLFAWDVATVFSNNPNSVKVWAWIGLVLWGYNTFMFFRLARNERAYVAMRARVDKALEDYYDRFVPSGDYAADAAEDNPLTK